MNCRSGWRHIWTVDARSDGSNIESRREQHTLHEQHAAGITQRVQQLCREAEEVARRIVAQSQELERRIAEQAS